MPNYTGGKNYKKSKHSSEGPTFVEATEDQMYGRVIQVLGNRNTLVYCNDNVVRLCHIRGSIRKDMWIGVGDIVLVSARDFLRDVKDKYEKGDILYKYDRDHYSKLKKDDRINVKLFSNLETADVAQLKRIKEMKVDKNIFSVEEETDDIFDDTEVPDDEVNIDTI
jgi:translation initiation factor 1A